MTGRLSEIRSGTSSNEAAVQNESYLYDFVGNLTQRQNGNLTLTENFFYDDLHRLDYSTLGSTTNLNLAYDAMGNITSRSDVAGGATWTYHATKKHAVVQAGSSAFTYSYDANGNAQTRNGYALDWTSYNYPSVIRGPNKTMTFSYGPDRQRFKQIYTNGSNTETTMYIGGLLEKVTENGVTDWRHYVAGGGGMVAVVSRKSTGVNTTRYLLEDHQGSVSQILDSSGAIYVSENFTAFGARRDASTWSGACPCPDLTKIKDTTRRGYTGHEAIGGVSMGLNHMNGRVQDAITGRFLSPDPYVQAPGFTQSFNRYSYTFNNPLSYTDPSGFQAAPPEVEPPRGPGLDVIGGPYSGIADFHARAAWARLYGIRNAMARWMRNTHPEFFSTPTQFANSRIAGGAGGGNPGRGHAGGGNTGGPGSEPPNEDFGEHQVGSGLVEGSTGGGTTSTVSGPLFTMSSTDTGVTFSSPALSAGLRWLGTQWGRATNRIGDVGDTIEQSAIDFDHATLGFMSPAVAVFGTAGAAINRNNIDNTIFWASLLTPVKGLGGAQNVMNGVRLSRQLSLESANSVFTATGELSQGAITGARQIFAPGTLGNPAIPSAFGKYATGTFASPSGPFQVHFYMNPTTGAVIYGLDYKVIFNLGL